MEANATEWTSGRVSTRQETLTPFFWGGLVRGRMEKREGFLQKHFREVEKGKLFLDKGDFTWEGFWRCVNWQVSDMFHEILSTNSLWCFTIPSSATVALHMTQERSQTKAWLMFGIISFQHWVVVNFHKYSFQRFWFWHFHVFEMISQVEVKEKRLQIGSTTTWRLGKPQRPHNGAFLPSLKPGGHWLLRGG